MTVWPNQLIPCVQDSDKFSTQGLQSTEDPWANLCWIKSGGSECWILVKELQTGDICTTMSAKFILKCFCCIHLSHLCMPISYFIADTQSFGFRVISSTLRLFHEASSAWLDVLRETYNTGLFLEREVCCFIRRLHCGYSRHFDVNPSWNMSL